MPKLLPHASAVPTINLVKNDLTNNSQYSDAVSWVTSRIICPFGYNQFAIMSIIQARYTLRISGDIDMRTKVAKELLEAETQLSIAASRYDAAIEAVRASFRR